MTAAPPTAAPLNAEPHSQVPKNRVLIVGCGYLGIRVAQIACRRGDRLWATTRRRDRAVELARKGIEPLIADWTDRRTLGDLPPVDRVLIAVSYDRHSRHSRQEAQLGGLRNLLEALHHQGERHRVEKHHPPRGTAPPDLCYISTTGVYHHTDGRWVDETSPTHPTRLGGKVHLQAEQLLHRITPRAPWTILRLAGIYGPGRVPRAADVIAGRPVTVSDETGYLNLIHVDDAARAVLACWDRGGHSPSAGPPAAAASTVANPRRRLYVVADDRPVIRRQFYREIARQSRSPPPQFVPPTTGDAVSRRSETNKRIWNRRMKLDLLPRLQFPSYREGLAQIVHQSPITGNSRLPIR